jgi:hypothetical protein
MEREKPNAVVSEAEIHQLKDQWMFLQDLIRILDLTAEDIQDEEVNGNEDNCSSGNVRTNSGNVRVCECEEHQLVTAGGQEGILEQSYPTGDHPKLGLEPENVITNVIQGEQENLGNKSMKLQTATDSYEYVRKKLRKEKKIRESLEQRLNNETKQLELTKEKLKNEMKRSETIENKRQDEVKQCTLLREAINQCIQQREDLQKILRKETKFRKSTEDDLKKEIRYSRTIEENIKNELQRRVTIEENVKKTTANSRKS